MNEIIRKLRPTDYWHIGEHESWFEYMASKGLHLKSMGPWFAKFVKGEPKQMRYRIEISCDKAITSDQKEMYSESGWDYVTTHGSFNVFSSPVELNAPELHTDPAEQSYTLKELNKQFISSAIITVLGMTLPIWIIYYFYLRNSTYTLSLVNGALISQITLIVCSLYVVYDSIKTAISIRTLQKTLSEGRPINHNSPWKNRRKISLILNSIFVLGVIFPAFIQFASSKTIPLAQAPTDLPIIRLNDIEENSILTGKTSSYCNPNNIDESTIYYNCSFFAPAQYYFSQCGKLPNKVEKYESKRYYSPSITTWVYQLRFPAMGKDLLSDLIKEHNVKYKERSFTEINNKDFDKLIIFEGEDNSKEIFALKGKAVIHVSYSGYADKDSIIKSIAEKIDYYP